jgi:hypothetical protein
MIPDPPILHAHVRIRLDHKVDCDIAARKQVTTLLAAMSQPCWTLNPAVTLLGLSLKSLLRRLDV